MSEKTITLEEGKMPIPHRRFDRPPNAYSGERALLSPEEIDAQNVQIEEIRRQMEESRMTGNIDDKVTLRYSDTGRVALGAGYLDWDRVLEEDRLGKYYVGTIRTADEL